MPLLVGVVGRVWQGFSPPPAAATGLIKRQPAVLLVLLPPQGSGHPAVGRQVNGGQVGRHWSEPLALNAVIIAQGAGKLSQGTRRVAECSDGFWSVYRYGIFFRFALEMRDKRSRYGFVWVPFPSCLCRFGGVRAASGDARFDCLITHLLSQMLRFQH